MFSKKKNRKGSVASNASDQISDAESVGTPKKASLRKRLFSLGGSSNNNNNNNDSSNSRPSSAGTKSADRPTTAPAIAPVEEEETTLTEEPEQQPHEKRPATAPDHHSQTTAALMAAEAAALVAAKRSSMKQPQKSRDAFDFPSPAAVGPVRRIRSASNSGTPSTMSPVPTLKPKQRYSQHRLTPNLPEKDLLKAMPILIRLIYDNKPEKFQSELRALVMKQQPQQLLEMVDKHHKRNIFHWIALLNRQNIAKIAVETINNAPLVDELMSAVDSDGRSALHLASIHQHMLMVRMCLNLSSQSVNTLDFTGMSPLAYAIDCGGDISVCTALLGKGADPNGCDSVSLMIFI